MSLNQILESRDWAYDAKQSSIKLEHEIPYEPTDSCDWSCIFSPWVYLIKRIPETPRVH
jgi:hypothetical protein